jgi:hypothetical protein
MHVLNLEEYEFLFWLCIILYLYLLYIYCILDAKNAFLAMQPKVCAFSFATETIFTKFNAYIYVA